MLFHDPYFNHNEGALNVLTIDDARPVNAWSRHHAEYALGELDILARRAEAVRWALDDVRARGLDGQAAAYEAQLAQVEALQARHRAQVARIEAARPAGLR